jgi:hypothetical protein
MATTTVGDCCVSLMQGTLVRPVPRYPSSVATDAALKIAANQVTTTLITRVSSLDTIFRVSGTSRLVVDMLLTIDSEIVSVSVIDPAASIITVIRGFDGTIPASHSAGRTLAAYVVAWHHNALAAEIKAIEQALGPNLSNVPGAASGGLISTRYIWQQQPASGDLSVGSNVITLSPVPPGVNGSDLEHYVYVSGGTGAPEACRITGGTAVSGAPSGTLFITCANAHTGSWAIGTATAGIQEALVAGSSYSTVRIPYGIHHLYATVFVNDHQTLAGEGRGATQLYFHLRNADGVMVGRGARVGSITIRDLLIQGMDATSTAGYALTIRNAQLVYVGNLHIAGFWSGLHITETTSFVNVTACHFDGLGAGSIATAIGINIDCGGAGVYMNNLELIGYASGPQPRAGVQVSYVGTVEICTADILHMGSGLRFCPAAAGQIILWCFFTNVTCDAGDQHGIEIAPENGGDIVGLNFTGCWSSSSSKNGVYAVKGTGARLDGLSFVNHMCVANQHEGWVLNDADNVTINSSATTESGASPSAPNTYPGLYAINTGGLMISGSRFGRAFGSPTGEKQNYGIQLDTGNVDYIIEGNNLRGNLTSAMANASSSAATGIVRNNLGIDDPSPTVLPSGDVLTMTSSTHHVSGTLPIFYIGGPGTVGGLVRLIADGAWSLGAGGNISAAVTMTAGRTITLYFDSVSSNWCPSL